MTRLTVLALFCAGLVLSQVNTSRLDCAVTVRTGAAVPGAGVTVTNLAAERHYLLSRAVGVPRYSGVRQVCDVRLGATAPKACIANSIYFTC
jgi:hypothetical protein